MWLVQKFSNGTASNRVTIPPEIHDPMLRWYIGEGGVADEAVGVELVRSAKHHDRWLACECRGAAVPPPLLSPAYITVAQTYYLRRLTGTGRPPHDPTCPFHRDQADYLRDRGERGRAAVTPPQGYFAVLAPLGEHLAQKTESQPDTRASGVSIPRLAKLLWLLIKRAGADTVGAIGNRAKPSLILEFQRLKAAAANLEIAPGIPLSRFLFTHPEDFRRRRIYAQLREAAPTWPSGHEPGAFLLLYAKAVTAREIILADGDPILVASDISKPPRKHIDAGPYLVLVAVGTDQKTRGYAALSAYAQPILNGHHFIPVHTTRERQLLALVLKLQWQLRDAGIASMIEKPTFDVDTPDGFCRPAVILDTQHHADRYEQSSVLRLLEDTNTDATDRLLTNARLRSIGEIIEIAAVRLDDPDQLLRDLTVRVSAKPFADADPSISSYPQRIAR